MADPRTLQPDFDFRRDPKTACYCIVCQKDIAPSKPCRWVFLRYGVDRLPGEIVHPEDVHLHVPTEEDIGWARIGSECLRKIGKEWSTDAPTGNVGETGVDAKQAAFAEADRLTDQIFAQNTWTLTLISVEGTRDPFPLYMTRERAVLFCEPLRSFATLRVAALDAENERLRAHAEALLAHVDRQEVPSDTFVLARSDTPGHFAYYNPKEPRPDARLFSSWHLRLLMYYPAWRTAGPFACTHVNARTEEPPQ